MPRQGPGWRRMNCSQLLGPAVALVMTVFADPTQSFAAECNAPETPYVVGGESFCVPDGVDGYSVRKVGEGYLAFDEQYFVGPDRVTEVDTRTLTDSKERRATAVLTSIRVPRMDADVGTAIRMAILNHNWDSYANQPILLEVDHWYNGHIEVQFTKSSDDRFDGLVTSIEQDEIANDLWFAFIRNGSIDYILGCYASLPDSRPQLVCYGTFAVGRAEAFVDLYGLDISGIASAFVANRHAIMSFLAR